MATDERQPGSDRPLRVLHAVLTLDAGGLERVVVDLVRTGAETGQEVAVVCLDRPGTLAAQAEAAGARIYSVGRQPGERLSVLVRLDRVLTTFRPDVVHTHQIGALLHMGPVTRRRGLRAVVHTEHGKHYAARRRLRVIGRLAGWFAARFCCVSRDIAAEVLRCRIVPRRKVRVVPNGIDTKRFARGGPAAELRAALGIPLESPVVGTVGRLTEIKRHDVLLRAFAAVRERIPAARLLIVGDGQLREQLEALSRELGVAPAVHFAGYRASAEEYFRVLDVFALTSRSEGTPLAVLEACASGVPVVASAVGGLPDIVTHGRTGLLFPAGDVAALAGTLAGLLADPQARERLAGEAQRDVAARYGLERMAAEYRRQYQELLGPPARRVRCAS